MLKRLLSLTLITALSTLSITSEAYSTSGMATITSMHNRVQEKTSSNPSWHKSQIKSILHAGDSIRTGSLSRAEITYSDGTVTRIGPHTVMRVSEHSAQRTNLKLITGKLWLKVSKGNGRLQIQTPTATAAVLGTELLVTNDENDISHVTTLDGLVEVTGSEGDKMLVKPGEWVEIAPGKKIEAPTKFDWDSLKKNERFMLDTSFVPTTENLLPKSDEWN